MINIRKILSLLFLLCSFIICISNNIVAIENGPVIDELYQIENADKFIYGHAMINENGNYRDANADEVYVTIREYDADNNIVKDYTGVTVDAYSIYGAKERNGIFVISLDDKFAKVDHKFEIISAYSVVNSQKYDATTDDIKTNKIVVKDVIPPNPVTLLDRVYANSKFIKGLSDTPDAKLTIAVNGKEIKITDTYVDSTGKWQINLPTSLSLNSSDIIMVFLEDEFGNKNPVVTKQHHDMIFYAASSIRVSEANPILSGSKTVENLSNSSGIFKIGDSIEYTIKFKVSDGKAYVLNIIDKLPTGVEYVSHEAKVNNEINLNNVFRKDNDINGMFANLKAGDEVEITINGIITDDALNKSIENTVLISGQNSYGEKVIDSKFSDENNALISDSDVEPELLINKRVVNSNSETYYLAGDIIKYEIDVEAKKASLNNLIISDVITSDLIVENSLIDKTNGVGNLSKGNKIKYSIKKLEANEKITITVIAKISNNSVGKEISNQANAIGYSNENVSYGNNSNIVTFKVLNVNLQITMQDFNKNNVAEAGEKIGIIIKIANNENITLNNMTISNDLNYLLNCISNSINNVPVNIFENDKLINETKLRELKDGFLFNLHGNSEVILNYQINVRDDLDIYQYQELITNAQLNLFNVDTQLNTGKMRTISGTVFEDLNYNNKNDDNKVMNNIEVSLIDNHEKIINQCKSNNKGKYSIKILDQPIMMNSYRLKVEELPGYLLADVKESNINYNTLVSTTVNLKKNKLDNYNIGYAKDVTTSVISSEQSVDYGDYVVSNINYSNGKISNIKKSNGIIKTKLKGNALRISGLKVGKGTIAVTFKDNYSRNEITRFINVKVNKYNISTQDEAISNLIKNSLSKNTGGSDFYNNNDGTNSNILPQSGFDVEKIFVIALIGILGAISRKRRWS